MTGNRPRNAKITPEAREEKNGLCCLYNVGMKPQRIRAIFWGHTDAKLSCCFFFSEIIPNDGGAKSKGTRAENV